MKKLISAAAFVASTFAPAMAQDAVPFSGPWIGFSGGFDSVNLKLNGDSGSDNGVLYGVNAGYDFNLGGAVIGVEAELSDSTVKESGSDVLVANDQLSLAASRDIYAGVRVGVPVSSSVLAYAKGGYSNARAKLSYTDSTGTYSEGDNLDGFRIGAGVEYSVNKVIARVEYRYSDYGTYDYAGVSTGLKTSRHQIAVTGGWRF